MKVLVTGASGFIGQHVCKALAEAGYSVVKMDLIVLSTSYLDVSTDITKPIDPIDGLDAVIHLAAMANPRACDSEPSKAFDVNVNGSYQVLKMALESGAKKVVFSSTAHVYDIPPRYLPTDEIHPLRLNNTYTTTKLLGEQLCELYWTNHGLAYTTLRLFNAYGPCQTEGYFIPDQIAKARTGTITVKGSNVTKDWVYVEDVARAFVLALESPFVGPINIGTGEETQLGIVANLIARVIKAEVYWDPADDATRMQADISRAERVLEWTPTITIEEGINAILDAEKAVAVH